jgi:hypothetical protein
MVIIEQESRLENLENENGTVVEYFDMTSDVLLKSAVLAIVSILARTGNHFENLHVRFECVPAFLISCG